MATDYGNQVEIYSLAAAWLYYRLGMISLGKMGNTISQLGSRPARNGMTTVPG